MTFFSDASVRPAAPSRIAAFFEAVSLKLRQRKAYRSTYYELSDLSNRELADLGMTRCDIRRLSLEAAEMSV